jgi:hypothetical protein
VKVHEVLRRVLRRARSDDEDGGCLCHGEHKSQARNLLHCTTRESHIYPRSDFHLCRVFFPPVQMMTFIPGGVTTRYKCGHIYTGQKTHPVHTPTRSTSSLLSTLTRSLFPTQAAQPGAPRAGGHAARSHAWRGHAAGGRRGVRPWRVREAPDWRARIPLGFLNFSLMSLISSLLLCLFLMDSCGSL